MKNSVWDKLLLVLMSLIIAGIAVFAIGVALHMTDGELICDIVRSPAESLPKAVASVIIGLALLALALRTIYAFLILKGNGREQESSVFIRQGESGSLYISAEALRTMVRQYCKRHALIKSCECGDIPDEKNDELQLSLSFDAEADIAKEVAAIQDGLSKYLLDTCGLQIKKICITIVPTTNEERAITQ